MSFVTRLISRGTLLFLIVGLPWLFGGVRPSHHLILAAGLLTALSALLPNVASAGRAWYATRWNLLLLAAGVGLGAMQLSDRAGDWIARWNPKPRELRAEFTARADHTPTAAPQPPTLDPAATRHDTAALICAAVAFALGAALFAETRAMLWLMATAATVGTALALFGLIQRLSWNGLIYWQFSTEGGIPFGPFINRNNAGGFLELTLAAAVGLFVYQVLRIPSLDEAERRDARRYGPAWQDWTGRRRKRISFSTRCTWFMAHLTTPLLASAAAVIVISAGILATYSRGSVVSLVAGSAAALLLMGIVIRRLFVVVVPAVLVVLGLSLVVWLGQSATLTARLSTLLNGGDLRAEPRLDHWQTSLRSLPDFWLVGSGLGTYRYTYTRYQESPTSVVYLYAENQYLDALLSGGVIGLTLFAGTLLLFASAVLKLLRQARSPTDLGIAATAALLLTCGMTHACFDFAMYTAAYFLPLAVLGGALVCRARGDAGTAAAADLPRRTARWGRLVGALLLWTAMVGGLAWSGEQFRRGWTVQHALAATPIVDTPQTRADVAALDTAIAEQQRAVDVAPDDAAAWLHLSDLWSARYTRAFRRELAEMPVDPIFWQWESPTQLHAVAGLLARTLDEPALAALRSNRLLDENLRPALAAARTARGLCPLSGYAQLVTARLCFIDEAPQNDAFYLDRAEQLDRGYDDRLYDIGVLHLNASRVDRAIKVWRRSWQLSDRFEIPMLSLASGYFSPEELLERLVPANPVTIARVAEAVFGQPERTYEREVFYERALELLRVVDTPAADQYELWGRIELQMRRYAEAVEHLGQAVELDPLRAEWFSELAAAYVGLGQYDRARSAAQKCVDLVPNVGKYREQLARIAAAQERQTPKP